MYSAGDLITFQKLNEELRYGEILGIDLVTRKLEVSWLKRTEKQECRIWEFVADDEWSDVDVTEITKHVSVDDKAPRSVVLKAWKEIGFLPGGDGITFCRVSDENTTTLPIYGGDESDEETPDDDDDDEVSSNPEMHGYADDGFVVPDDEGEAFEFADPSKLDEAGAKFVRETHQAVHDFAEWNPEDKQGKAIKNYVDNMDTTASLRTDNARFATGKNSIRTSKPPLNKRKRK